MRAILETLDGCTREMEIKGKPEYLHTPLVDHRPFFAATDPSDVPNVSSRTYRYIREFMDHRGVYRYYVEAR